MSTMPIFRWSGAYVGFLHGDRLYDAEGTYLGWVDARKHVWFADGAFLGYLKHENYVLRNVHREELNPRPPRATPRPLTPDAVPPPKQRRPPKPALHGWVDALDALFGPETPATDETAAEAPPADETPNEGPPADDAPTEGSGEGEEQQAAD